MMDNELYDRLMMLLQPSDAQKLYETKMPTFHSLDAVFGIGAAKVGIEHLIF